MADTWVTDMRHYLDSDGSMAMDMPAPALNLALFQGSIVAWVTTLLALNGSPRTNVHCRRRPGRYPCAGEIHAALALEEPDTIIWHCPLCGDNGFIRGWEGTPWDRRLPNA
jgi:hypothetical protein